MTLFSACLPKGDSRDKAVRDTFAKKLKALRGLGQDVKKCYFQLHVCYWAGYMTGLEDKGDQNEC